MQISVHCESCHEFIKMCCSTALRKEGLFLRPDADLCKLSEEVPRVYRGHCAACIEKSRRINESMLRVAIDSSGYTSATYSDGTVSTLYTG